MAFAFSYVGTEYRLDQTGTDANLTSLATAVNAVATVARLTSYTVGTIIKPPTKNGMWYRCSVAGTTAATAPTYNLTAGTTTTDGTAQFFAFIQPEIYVEGVCTVYEITNFNLRVNGTLTIDPRINAFFGINNITTLSGGTLNCGVQFNSTFGGGLLYSQGTAIQFIGNYTQAAGSTFNLRGATMHSTKSTQAVHEFNGTTFVRSGYWLGQPGNNSRLRLNVATFDVDGFYVYGVQADTLMTPTAGTIIKNYKAVNVGVGIDNALAGGGGLSTEFVFDGVPSTIGNVSTGYSNWVGQNNLVFLNCEAGSLEMVMPDNCGNFTTSGFGGRLYQKYQISVQNTSSVAIQGAITYLKDTNNGFRKVKNVRNATPIDNMADQIQILTTNASGLTPVTNVLTSYIYRNNTVADIGQPDGNEIRDLRGKINTAGSDLFDVTVFEYNYQITNIFDIPMKGLSNVVSGTKMLADTNVTLSKTNAVAKLASSFTIDTASKTIVVRANSTYDDLYDVVKAFKCNATQANLETPTLNSLIVNANGSTLTAYTGWTLVVNTGVTLTTGSGNFTKLQAQNIVIVNSATMPYLFNAGGVLQATGFLVPSTVLGVQDTYSGAGAITGVYQDSTGTSTVLQLTTVVDGYSLCVYKSDGTTKYFASNVATGTYTVYFKPDEAGSYLFAAERYGDKRISDTIGIAGGIVGSTLVNQEDVGIAVTNKATVAAYTTIDNYDEFYDYTAYKRLEETYIKLGQIATRDGLSLNISAPYSVKVNQSASSVYNLASNIFTIKTNTFANGVKFTNMILVPPATLSPTTNELLTGNWEDANGDSSIDILGALAPFSIYKFPITTPFPSGSTDNRLDPAFLIATITDRRYRFINDPAYNYFVWSASKKSGDNIPNISEGQTAFVSMTKGAYTAYCFQGAEIQLVQAPKVDLIYNDIQSVLLDTDAIKGTGFTKDVNSLTNITEAIETQGTDLTADLTIINNGVKKASIFVPHNTSL
jgi:hypothetical protein